MLVAKQVGKHASIIGIFAYILKKKIIYAMMMLENIPVHMSK